MIKILIAAIIAIEAVLLYIACLSPPNSADAMAYHLPRVIYWAQQGSVRFFPTPYLNQIMLQPLAEYFILHTYLLTGGDHLANLVQWLGSAGSIIGVAAIAREFGAGPRGQAIAALFCATLPNGILQASGTKNDYLLALWLVAFVYFLLRRRPLWAGAALGLGLLTKATAYLYAPAIAIAIVATAPREFLSRRWVVAPVVALLINLPQYVRNLDLSGSPIGYDSAQANGFFRWRNERFSFIGTASNILRHTAEQLGARSQRWNQGVYEVVVNAHRAIGADPNDPSTTWPWEKFRPPRNTNHEADANNRWHLLLLILCVGSLLFRPPGARVLALYAGGVALALVFFCVYLKWQPFMPRMFLPLFVLAAPLVGTQMERLRPAFLQVLVCLFLLNNARPYLFENWTRPLTGPNSLLHQPRQEAYFNDMKQWSNRDAYFAAQHSLLLTGCRDVGIDSHDYQLEYPLIVLLHERNPSIRFQHVNVQNASAKYARAGQPPPCATVKLSGSGPFTIRDMRVTAPSPP